MEEITRSLVIGMGGAGSVLAERMAGTFAQADYLAIDTDAKALARLGRIPTLPIGARVTGGHGARRSIELGRLALLSSLKDVQSACREFESVLLLAGLAGGTGSGATLELADELLQMGTPVGVVGVRPFDFEGEKARMNTEHALEQLSIMGIPKVVLGLNETLDLQTPGSNLFDSMTNLEERAIDKAIGLLHELLAASPGKP
ncbi:MAG: hypothetical protein PHI49_08550 [Halothiobacillaceae bacterium]|nr:hypothetical protein [Halothiobacillaceae bacterium]